MPSTRSKKQPKPANPPDESPMPSSPNYKHPSVVIPVQKRPEHAEGPPTTKETPSRSKPAEQPARTKAPPTSPPPPSSPSDVEEIARTPGWYERLERDRRGLRVSEPLEKEEHRPQTSEESSRILDMIKKGVTLDDLDRSNRLS